MSPEPTYLYHNRDAATDKQPTPKPLPRCSCLHLAAVHYTLIMAG